MVTASPYVVHEQSLNPDYITIERGFTTYFILGPHFFEDNTPYGPQRCSIADARCCALLQKQAIPALQERDCLETTVLMQDGAPHKIARTVQPLLRAHFGDERVIFRRFPTA
ncbi:hypothetical protein AVEN_119775-1 [Araneus ventricosus]|uniref:DUF4817 domain-containing protein n=1 Tax=Araneus ventricosus TaxID=182803 RepID=A0A4Y2KD46_ARAVE|nr:hypothetical protein AVEN_119775-1 [Araneus ventricosus]